jgi:hypothetical protein
MDIPPVVSEGQTPGDRDAMSLKASPLADPPSVQGYQTGSKVQLCGFSTLAKGCAG